ncbi:hypothetical protein BCIN_11g01820 [Botrytis cinerea B05.10]|uniref:Uncharacterized protein n=1 Tax=Botryotinia fuckeliana (strain B05.10) TaxID=332648 RepID=A0A384JWC8_BOTFB|nr:hypothetical protein BCIN_11g01820 [Botrytis cinerea B05.10]ATZ54860.1 hypothetical protein BCIN_11g01820 [Botrytis cinerea B05.10]
MPSLFNEQLAIIPSETSTRALCLILPPIRTRALDRSVKTAPRRSGPKIRASDRLLELATLSSDVHTTTNELLETRYNTNIKFGLSSSVSGTMAPGASQLGFDFGRSRSTRPRPDLRWIINDSGNFKTVVVYHRVWMGEYDPIINLREEAIQKSTDTVTQSLIANWNDFTDLDTKFIESSPIDWLFPLIRDLKAYFLFELGELKYRIQYWLGVSYVLMDISQIEQA